MDQRLVLQSHALNVQTAIAVFLNPWDEKASG